MIHIIDIDIPDRKRWGDVFAKDIALPAKVRKINGVLGNITLGNNTYLERLVTSVEVGEDNIPFIELGNPISLQIGVFSLSVNNAGIINTNSPCCVVGELTNSSYKHNLIKIDGGLTVRNGSMARIVIEEKHLSPFLSREMLSKKADDIFKSYPKVAAQYSNDIDKLIREILLPAYTGLDDIKLTNDYKVKIYVDYDK